MRAPSPGAIARAVAAALAVAVAGYAAVVAFTWYRYGELPPRAADEHDALLDRFMPDYEVVERHRIRVQASPALTLAAAREQDLQSLPLVRAIFRTRELVMGASPDDTPRPHGLLAEVQALGWGVLAEVPGREVVVGAVTQPWKADVVFRAIPSDAFAAFREPGYVKIAWTLRADPDGEGSIFRTETRAIATDAEARRLFRWYWSCASPGIALVRRLSLAPLKRDAESR